MQEFVYFITKNWILASLLGLSIVLLLQHYVSSYRFGIQMLGTEEVVTLINREQAVLLDVRRTEAFVAGHCLGALSVEHQALEKKIQTLEKYRSKSLIVVCQNGAEAKQSAVFLKKQGFKVFVLEGGMQQWRTQALPVVQS